MECILDRVLQKNKTNTRDIYIYKGIYHKELAHAFMEADKSRICRVNWQPRDPRKLMFQFKSKRRKKTSGPARRQSGRRNSLLLRGGSTFLC